MPKNLQPNTVHVGNAVLSGITVPVTQTQSIVNLGTIAPNNTLNVANIPVPAGTQSIGLIVEGNTLDKATAISVTGNSSTVPIVNSPTSGLTPQNVLYGVLPDNSTLLTVNVASPITNSFNLTVFLAFYPAGVVNVSEIVNGVTNPVQVTTVPGPPVPWQVPSNTFVFTGTLSGTVVIATAPAAPNFLRVFYFLPVFAPTTDFGALRGNNGTTQINLATWVGGNAVVYQFGGLALPVGYDLEVTFNAATTSSAGYAAYSITAV